MEGHTKEFNSSHSFFQTLDFRGLRPDLPHLPEETLDVRPGVTPDP